MKTESTNRELIDRALRVIPGGVNSGQRQVPGIQGLVLASTKGATFTDASGHTYIDFHAAFGPPILGHNDPDVDTAVISALRRTGLIGVGVSREEIELAEQIVDLIPSVEKVLLTMTGSEATYHALRLARAATGRKYILKFQGCYHGWHDAVALNVISPADKVGKRDPLSAGSLQAALEATIVLPFNDTDALEREFRERGSEIAAVILEPIPHNVGALLPRPGFLESVRRVCTKAGSVLVFDEVITGFRHGLGGYQAIVSVTPDLTTLGKAMANGYPISALGGRADLMDMFSTTPGNPVFFAGTFNGHPPMAAAASATIAKLKRENVHEHLFRLGDHARRGLVELFGRLGIPAVVSGFGSVFVTYFLDGEVNTYSDLLRNDAHMFVTYRSNLMEHGVFELPLNLKRSCVSYAHRDADIDALLEATEIAVRQVNRNRSGSV